MKINDLLEIVNVKSNTREFGVLAAFSNQPRQVYCRAPFTLIHCIFIRDSAASYCAIST